MIRLKIKKSLQINTKKLRGDGFSLTIIIVLIMVYLLVPLFSAVIEKQIVQLKAAEVTDALQMSCLATYDSLESKALSQAVASYKQTKTEDVFKDFLAANMNLNNDLTPKNSISVADGQVRVESIEIFNSDLPKTCPDGKTIIYPSVHATIIVPVKPSLYKGTILQLLGKDYIDCKFHIDTEVVIDN